MSRPPFRTIAFSLLALGAVLTPGASAGTMGSDDGDDFRTLTK